MSEAEDSPDGGQHPLDPDPPRPPGAPDLDLDIPTPDSSGESKPDNEDVPDDEKVPEPPD